MTAYTATIALSLTVAYPSPAPSSLTSSISWPATSDELRLSQSTEAYDSTEKSKVMTNSANNTSADNTLNG